MATAVRHEEPPGGCGRAVSRMGFVRAARGVTGGADSEHAEDEPWQPPAEGSMIRLMGEHTVEVPLWCDGLLFDDRAELESHFGVSEPLATDLVAWAAAWEDGHHGAELDREAARLVRRLNHELGYRYTFVYPPRASSAHRRRSGRIRRSVGRLGDPGHLP